MFINSCIVFHKLKHVYDKGKDKVNLSLGFNKLRREDIGTDGMATLSFSPDSSVIAANTMVQNP
jgi:hypothetical protein